jgi:hypothetical protein
MKKVLQVTTSIIIVLSLSFFSPLKAQNSQIEKETQLNIYPNPVISGQMVKVELEVDENKIVNYYIFDFAGRMVEESTGHRLGFGEVSLEKEFTIEDKGLYFVKVIMSDVRTNAKKSMVKKLSVN